MKSYRQLAPAKVNLALDVLGPRPNGYHNMRMVMQTVSLFDTIAVRETETDFFLQMEGFDPPKEKKTLEQLAAEAFFSGIGRPMPGLHVELVKQIPAYAGLGGGSADAAALLRLLRTTYAPELSKTALERIGLTVGSDVPFCIQGGTALAEGRGEVLTALPPLPPCRIVLCKPNFDLPTPGMFARLRQHRIERRPDINGMSAALAAGDLAGTAEKMENVFEEVLPPDVHREIAFIKEHLLRCGALGAVMSGSGPTVFGLFEDGDGPARAMDVLKETYQQVFLAGPVGQIL